MTTVLDIIARSYRESNIVSINAVATSAQIAEGLARLQSLIASTYGYDVGEELTDLHVGYIGHADVDYDINSRVWTYPQINTRLILNHNEPQTIYLPANPRNGSRIAVVDVYEALFAYPITLQANGNQIENTDQVILNIAGFTRVWIYDDAQANWLVMPTVSLVEEQMPFGIEFDDYFIIKLASRLNPAYGRSLNQESLMRLQDQQTQIEARYKQTRVKPVADKLSTGLRTPGRYGRRVSR